MSNFQSNVDNMYLQSMVPSSNRAAELEAERKRTKGIQNLVRMVKNQPLIIDGANYASSTQTAMPSREEIEAEQALKGARSQGIQTPEDLSSYLSGINASLGATKAVMDEKDSFDFDASNLLKSTNTAISGANELYLSQQLNSPQALTK